MIHKEHSRSGMRTFINTVGIVCVMIIVLTFAMQNTTSVEIKYYNTFTQTFPVWFLIFIPFFLGVVAGNLLDVIQRFKLKNEINKLKRDDKPVDLENPL